MAFVTPALVDAIAHSIDIPKLSAEAAKALAPDVEYKLRELIQDAQKFSRHARRQKLTTEDVNNALRMRNVEPIYGFSSKDPAKYIKAAGLVDVYAIEDREIPVDQLVEQPLPRAPVEVGVMPHWLFINGVQPLTPENTPLERPSLKRPRPALQLNQPAKTAAAAAGAAAAEGTGKAAAGDGQAVQVQLPVQHVLPLELQLYFSKALEVLQAALDQAHTAFAKPPTTGPTKTATQAGAAVSEPAGAAPGTSNQQVGQAKKTDAPRYWGQLDATSSGSAGTLQPAAAAGGAAAASVQGKGQSSAADTTLEDGASEDPKLAAVLASLATDPVAQLRIISWRAASRGVGSQDIGALFGLHALCPYLVKFIADGVTTHLANIPALLVLLRLARSILRNENMGLEGYVHQLLPALLTCVVAKGIGGGRSTTVAAPDHTHVRHAAAQLVSEVCARFTSVHLNVQARVSKTYLKALLDPTKPLTTHYGAVLGLAALGPAAVRMLLLPQLPAYLDRLQPLLPDTSAHDKHTSLSTTAAAQGHGSTSDAMDVDLDGDGDGRVNNGAPKASAHSGQQGTAEEGPSHANGSTSQSNDSVELDAVRVHGAIVDAVASCLYELMVSAAADAVPETETALSRPSTAVLAKVAEALREQQQGADMADTDRSRAAAVLTVAWKEDVGLSTITWAACELLGPALQARLPQARPAHALL